MNFSEQQICHLKDVITVLSALFALGAAISWGGAIYWGWFKFLHTPFEKLESYLKWQARYNAVAAGCAAIAALMQLSVSWLFPVCRAFA
jgi:hypothetical protein